MPFIQFIADPTNAGKLPSKKKLLRGIMKGMKKGMPMLRDEAKKFGGANQLKIRTGNLRDSIQSSVKQEGDRVIGYLGAGSRSVLYARIHEFGGKSGRGYKATIPPRPYLSTAIRDNENELTKILNRNILQGFRVRRLF